jgi:hypothetical protein
MVSEKVCQVLRAEDNSQQVTHPINVCDDLDDLPVVPPQRFGVLGSKDSVLFLNAMAIQEAKSIHQLVWLVVPVLCTATVCKVFQSVTHTCRDNLKCAL